VISAGSTAFAFAASFSEPSLQRLLRAAGKSIRSVYRAAVGKNRAGIAIEALDRGGPTPAADWRIFGFTQRFGDSVSFAFGLCGADNDLVCYSRRTCLRAECDKKRYAFRRSRLLCVTKGLLIRQRRGRVGPRRSNQRTNDDVELGNSDTPAEVWGQRRTAL
jgi:hypothetical protein